MKTLRFGLIGLGRFGKHYLRLLSSMPNVELAVIVNRSDDAFREFKEKIPANCLTTTQIDLALNDPSIDAIVIATPASVHCEMILSALNAGKNVFVEKPMVMNSDEAELVAQAVDKSGKVFMVGYQFVYHDAIKYLKNSLQKNNLGEIKYYFGEHFSPGPFRQDVNSFVDAGTHDLSVIQYLFSPGRVVSANGSVDDSDISAVSICFENGLRAGIVTSLVSPEKVRKMSIVGSTSSAVLDDRLDNNKLKLFDSIESGFASLASPELEYCEPLLLELQHFLDCLRTGDKPLTGINFGCAVTEMCDTILKQVRP
jgi:predicted dehydrogenase